MYIGTYTLAHGQFNLKFLYRIYGNFTMETILATAFGRSADIQRGESDQIVDIAKLMFSGSDEKKGLSFLIMMPLLSEFELLPVAKSDHKICQFWSRFIPMARVHSQGLGCQSPCCEERTHNVLHRHGNGQAKTAESTTTEGIYYVHIIMYNYVIVITRARGMYGIYCTEARGRQPRGLSAIYAMQPECTCYN